MALTDEEIMQILKLVDESDFDQFQLETSDLKLAVSKKGSLENFEDQPRSFLDPGRSEPEAATSSRKEAPAGPGQDKSPPPPPADQPAEEGLVPITAPLMGIFYSRPDPESPPYVEPDKLVSVDDTVGLIEVMKLFNSVKAGVQGRIVRICVESGQMVEYGQTLFLIKPQDA